MRAATAAESAVWISRCSAAYAFATSTAWSRSSTSTMADCRPASDVVMRSACVAVGTWRSSSAVTASARASLGVTRTLAAIGSCSDWLIMSAATNAGSAVSSAITAISVGPASESIATVPWR